MLHRLLLPVLAITFLGACSEPPDILSGSPETVEEIVEQIRESAVSANGFCESIQVQVATRSDVSQLLECREDINPQTGKKGILIAFADQAAHLVDNGIEVTFDTAFAQLDALALAYATVGPSTLEPFSLYLVLFDDTCQNGWEVQPETLARLGAGQATLEQAMDEVDMYGNANCP